MSKTSYDVIGDIHGRFDKFEALMPALGYRASGDTFVPPEGRQAIFVGDLIDRGPEQVRLLKTVRRMIDAGHAQAVMGNHEFNAIAFVHPDPESTNGEFLRANRSDSPKSLQNRRQHAAFLAQVGEGSAEHMKWLEWFRTLPLHLDLGGIRVAHAWWDAESAALLDDPAHRDANGRLTDAFLVESHRKKTVLKRARKILTTGYEHKLPAGHFVTDGEGNKHDNARLKMWRHDATHMRDIAIVPGGDTSILPDLTIEQVMSTPIPAISGSPIFVGHYWFSGEVRVESTKLAVLDWSAAKNGPLVAYRWDGESELSNDKFVAVNV
jgi:hypothetical protein